MSTPNTFEIKNKYIIVHVSQNQLSNLKMILKYKTDFLK